MNISDTLAIMGIIVAVLAFVSPLAYQQWCRWHDRRILIKAAVHPHVFIDGIGEPRLHGMAVTLTSLGKEAIEVANVRVRLHGVNVLDSLLEGFTGAQPPQNPPMVKPSQTGIDISLRLEHEGKLLLNSNDQKGLRISKNHSARFFTPLPFHPLEVQQLFDKADDGQISIVADILPQTNKVLLKGSQISRTMRASLKAYRGKPHDPLYAWQMKVFTVSTTPADTWAIGKVNDKPISLKDEITKIPNRKASPADETDCDVSVADWRCEALKEVNTSLQELIAVPHNSGNQFHPQELMLSEIEAKSLLHTFSESIQHGTGFQMTLNMLGDQRPLTLSFCHDGTAAWAMFRFDNADGSAAHMHGLLALLPRQKQLDDAHVVETIRQFACLKDVPDRAFAQAMSTTGPIAAMFYADIGSANFPPIYSIMKILVAAFFISPGKDGINTR